MKVYERVLLAVYPLIFAGLALSVILLAAGVNFPVDNLQGLLADPVNRWAVGAGAGVIMIIALKLLLNSLLPPAAVQALVRQTTLGEVRITLAALENLVVRGANQVKGIRDVHPRVKVTAEGVAVFVQASVSPEAKIPEVSTELQKAIKESLEQTAGIEVLEARVLVNEIAHGTKGRVG